MASKKPAKQGRTVGQKLVITVLTALVEARYIAWPVDLIPDFVVGIGQLDDAASALVALVVVLVIWFGGKKTTPRSRAPNGAGISKKL